VVILFQLLLLYFFSMACVSSVEMKIHGKVTVWPKSQIVIPKDVRTLIGIKPGDDLIVVSKWDMAIAMVKANDLPKFLEYIHSEIEFDHQKQKNI